MLKTSTLLVIGVALANIALADRNVHFTGNFETGAIQKYGSPHDGFSVKTLPDPQDGVDQVVIRDGGAGPNTNLDTRVVPNEFVGSELVEPRKGNFFLRSAIYFDKDYSRFSGNSARNKPRMSFIIKKDSYLIDYDVESYTGFSVYLPQNLENETGKRGPSGTNQLFSIAAPGAAECFTLNYWVPFSSEGGGNDAHWWIRLNHSTTNTDRDQVEFIDLGSVLADKGKWTDFVIRWRSNPFSVDTNPYKAGVPNARDQLYKGNKGILQVWKSEGRVDNAGNRRMVLVVNKVNTAVGLVPHKDWKLGHSFRQYKHGWHKYNTSVAGPVWIGFDEIRFGLTNRDATSYSDVHPSQLACSDSCPGGSSTSPPPNPPVDLTVLP